MSRSHGIRNTPPNDNLARALLLDGISEAVEILDADWNFSYVNKAAVDLAGKTALELEGRNAWEEYPELVGSALEDACRRALREQVRIDMEFYFSRCAKWFEIHLHPAPRHLTIYATEITRRVQAEARTETMVEIESLNARLRQMSEAMMVSSVRLHELTETADLLNSRLHRAMQESHHRIKNNLQVVAALVEMQMGEIGAAAGDEHLKRINQHVRALANIHDMLTIQAQDSIEDEYLGTRAILERLIPMLQETSGGRNIRAEIEEVRLPTQQAASLCLLVSECIGNAVKHAKGVIEVTLRMEGDKARLEICDDGTGFPPDFDWREAAHTGLSLIDATARHDLRGEVRYENLSRGGGRVAITFPIYGVPTADDDSAVGSPMS